jgi:hypothetical protein
MPVLLQTMTVSIVLMKLVDRPNSMAGAIAAKQSQVDLTQYLGDTSTINTMKTLDQPGGGFTVTFPDQLNLTLQDSLYCLFEPMDMIEIRATRAPQNYRGQKLPLIMRGFVSSVQRVEAIGDDGSPQRQVVVRGIDSGKLWLIHQVNFMFLQSAGIDFLARFDLQAQLGLNAAFEPVSSYMTKLVDYMNVLVQKLSAYSNRMVPTFAITSTVTEGKAWIGGLSGKNGPLWSFVENFADRPWNEVFLVDEDAGPRLIFRPAPFKDLDGNFILADAVDPGSIEVTDLELISINLSRTDARVANLYWCPPASNTPETSGFITAGQIANALPLDTTYPNDNAALYGERMLQATTTLKPNEAALPSTMLPLSERPAADQSYLSWTLLRAKQLRAMNRDASVHEEGEAVVNGNERYTIGKYLKLTRGTIMSESYINTVTHNIAILQGWNTTLGLKRGTGFYNRDRATNVPWFAEGRRGPYTP